MASVRSPQFQAFSLLDDPAGLWVAEEHGALVAFAFSWVCDDLWFLAELFVSPAVQAQGVGNELLKRTLQHADRAGASTRALITFTFNRVSQALYIRHGIFPRMPIYFFNGAGDDMLRRLPDAPLRCVPVDNSAPCLAALARIDRHALGVSREKHHKFLLGDPVMQGALLYDGDNCVGSPTSAAAARSDRWR